MLDVIKSNLERVPLKSSYSSYTTWLGYTTCHSRHTNKQGNPNHLAHDCIIEIYPTKEVWTFLVRKKNRSLPAITACRAQKSNLWKSRSRKKKTITEILLDLTWKSAVEDARNQEPTEEPPPQVWRGEISIRCRRFDVKFVKKNFHGGSSLRTPRSRNT